MVGEEFSSMDWNWMWGEVWEKSYDFAFVDVAGAVEEGVHCE